MKRLCKVGKTDARPDSVQGRVNARRRTRSGEVQNGGSITSRVRGKFDINRTKMFYNLQTRCSTRPASSHRGGSESFYNLQKVNTNPSVPERILRRARGYAGGHA